jgi:hypothetical protein
MHNAIRTMGNAKRNSTFIGALRQFHSVLYPGLTPSYFSERNRASADTVPHAQGSKFTQRPRAAPCRLHALVGRRLLVAAAITSEPLDLCVLFCQKLRKAPALESHERQERRDKQKMEVRVWCEFQSQE